MIGMKEKGNWPTNAMAGFTVIIHAFAAARFFRHNLKAEEVGPAFSIQKIVRESFEKNTLYR
jgi:hypothetical protein